MATNWLGDTLLNLVGPSHPLPRNPERYLPNFTPFGGRTAEEHVASFKTTLRLLDVQHEDVACRLFPFTLEDMAYDWFLKLPTDSITTWAGFEMIFLAQFGQVIDPSTLYQHFATMRRDPNEPIWAFNAFFQKVYSRITPAYKPDNALALEMYKNALDPMINIFLRRAIGVDTLSLEYVEAINIDRQLNPHGHPFPVNSQANHVAPPLNPVPIIQAQPLTRLPLNQPLRVEYKDILEAPTSGGLVLVPTNSHAQATLVGPNRNELDAIQRMVQKLGNDFISLQRQVGSQEVPQRTPFYPK